MEKFTENYSDSKRMKKVTFGIIVVVIGALLMASNFGYLPYHTRRIFFSWEMLLIAIGLINLVSRENKTTGIILIGIGAFFLIPDVFRFSFSFVKLFWPVLLIGVGVSLIFLGVEDRIGMLIAERDHLIAAILVSLMCSGDLRDESRIRFSKVES